MMRVLIDTNVIMDVLFEREEFLDSVQAVSALTEGLDFIVTRDVKDYARSPIPAVSPQEFIARLG